MSCRERNKGEREEKEYENSSVGLKSKSARQSIGSIEDEPLTIDESLLIDPKLLFIGSKIGEGAHGIVYEGRYRERIVAIKVLHRGSTLEERVSRENRFARE